jgi:mono/diheme cytochrome c family protein
MLTTPLRAVASLGLMLFAATAAEPADLPSRVSAVFAAKCGDCHGPDVAKPKGHFGYVTDLGRVAANPEVVVPGKPEESKLWELVDAGKMPPRSARAGPLSAVEKSLIHDWIANGAPAATKSPDAESAAPPAPPPPPWPTRLLAWVGKQHVRLVHYPIALLTLAALAEVWLAIRRRREPWPPVRFGVLAGAATALITAGLGWLFADVAGYGQAEPQLLLRHRVLGTAAAAWCLGVAVLSERDARRGARGWAFRLALWAGAALVGAAAHYGGIMVYGGDFFAW